MNEHCGFTQFGETLLGKSFYQKQKELLDACRLGAYLLGIFNNGGGKTSEVLVSIVLGALTMLKARVFSTSGSFRQIKDQLNPALHAFKSRFPAYEFLENRINTRDPNCFYHGFATNEAGRFEGQHGSAEHPLVLLLDECKTVKDPVFHAVDRCRMPRQWCLVVFVSSAGHAGGMFHSLATAMRKNLTHPPVIQTSHECAHIAKSEIEADEQKWGREHPLVKSMHYSEFMGFVQGAIIQVKELDALLADPPPFEAGIKHAYCDPAWSESASGDESTMALRNGNKITMELAFREKGLHATAARYAQRFGQLGLRPQEIEMEADGEGEKIIRVLHAMNWPILRAWAGGEPRNSNLYRNKATENWVEGSYEIVDRRWILPDDPDLYAQMINRRYVPGNTGMVTIESKIAMKDPNREGGAVPSSPDKADAVFGCMRPLPQMVPKQVMGGDFEPRRASKDNPFERGTIWGDRGGEFPDLPGTHTG